MRRVSQPVDAFDALCSGKKKTFASSFLFCLEITLLLCIFETIILSLHNKMIVLSLFDWISCARVALQRAWFDVELYLASEVDKYAIQVAKQNRSETQHVWNVKSIRYWNWRFECEEGEFDMSSVDLLIWWSPCQDLSIAKKNRKGLDGEKSWLFREYVRILKETKPKRFILENVASMPKEAKAIITAELWVEPIMIDASLVSAQSRKRLFRTNIPGVTLPEDKWILLKDIIEDWSTTDLKSYCVTANYQKMPKTNYDKWQWQVVVIWVDWKEKFKSNTVRSSWRWSGYWDKHNRDTICIWNGAKNWLYKVWNINPSWRWMNGDVYSDEWKSPTLTTNKWEWRKMFSDYMIRKLTPVECERLQCLPDEYTAWISNSQRYKCLWNAFNVDVIAHILSFIAMK